MLQQPGWNDMAESYRDALAYTLQTLSGYLRTQRRDDLIMIVVGDHQPPAMITGEHASWDVPVHVITSNPALLTALQGCGFVPGVIPAPASLGGMHQLASALLYAFGAPEHAEGNGSMRCPLGNGHSNASAGPKNS